MKKTKRGYRKWFVFHTKHCLKKKKKSMVKIKVRICLNNNKKNSTENNTEKICLMKTNKKR